MLFYLLAFVLFLIIFMYYKNVYKPHQYWKEQGVLHVKPLPIMGNMYDFVLMGKSYPEWLKQIYKEYDTRYFGIYEYGKPVLMIKDPELIKKVTIKDFEYFMDHNNFFTLSKEEVFHLNIFNLKGKKWRQMRSTLSPAFTSSKMRTMFGLILECAEQFTEHMIELAKSKPDKQIIYEMKDLYSRFSNDVIASCAFGVQCNSLQDPKNEFYQRGKEVSSFTGIRGIKFIAFTMYPNLMNFLGLNLYSKNLIKFFRNLVNNMIDIREKNKIYRPDLIHLLMEARKGKLKHEKAKDDDAGFATVEESEFGKDTNAKSLTEDEMAAQVLVFFLAGFETSSTALSFLSYELAINEDIQRKLQQEIDETVDSCNDKISYEVILKMKYLDMVLTESLRKWPTVFVINRECTKPYTIEPTRPNEKPVHLQKHDSIMIPTDAMQKDPKFYPNPEKFDPERFSDANKQNIDPSTYTPFGLGPRSCIGSRFALLEIKAAIVYLLRKFDIVVTDKTEIPIKIHKSAQLLNSENGIYLGLKLRQS